MEIEGMPIPCCKIKHRGVVVNHFPTYVVQRFSRVIMASVFMKKIVPTYTDREDWANLVHSVAVSSHADVWVLRFGVFHVEFCCNVLNE